MKTAMRFAGLAVLGGGLVISGCGRKGGTEFIKDPEIRAQLKMFAVAKESQARSLATAEGHEIPPKVEEFFSAVENANWEETTIDYMEIRERGASDEVYHGSWWRTVVETYGAAEQFTLGDAQYCKIYGDDIIQSIPAGSIYFGGTDAGCFIVTAMQQSQIAGEPFYTLAQNPLVDTGYLKYLRSMYGNNIYIPTTADWQKCFDDYFQDFRGRQAKGELQPGESVTNGPDGKMQVNSHRSVIQIYGALAKVVFEKNTNRDFYVEESFPLEWMYPCLEPHGLIFKLDHQPLTSLPDVVVQQDHDYWTKTVAPMIGDWLKEDTSVQDIGAFAEKIYLRHDFSGFMGDTNFVENASAHGMYSKDRESIAFLYAWRAKQTQDAREKARMSREADFAFRQAWALSPASPEAVFSYVEFLTDENRTADALVVAATAAEFRSEPNATLDDLVKQLKQRLGTQ
jgi:hypothetical protein